jgi:hypothetical protein
MTDHAMPDFVDALEQQLRDIATAGRAQRHSARRWPARHGVTIALAVSGALVAMLVAFALPNRRDTRVDGKPLILQTAAVVAPSIIAELQKGVSVRAVLGPDAHLTEARPVKAFGSFAYVVTGDLGWCLVVPDPAIAASADYRSRTGVTCSKLADVYRYGISLVVGHDALAAVPQGVPHPTVTSKDGVVRELKPTEQGVVVVEDIPSGSVFTLYAKDRSQRSLHAHY